MEFTAGDKGDDLIKHVDGLKEVRRDLALSRRNCVIACRAGRGLLCVFQRRGAT